ncbi:kanadaptin-like isoform X2 [Physella acuta]|uniref:kanadaptin-like isoform X2 n=1 Tax=Physella acuta TaxID=109671 RepID=UPI0027DBC1E3|nr:kanadaptin-like isoform X2 [Physella acuta]
MLKLYKKCARKQEFTSFKDICGPPEDLEEESEMTITEMKAQKEKFQKEAELLRQIEMQEEMQRIEAEKKMLEDRGCGWGMDDDAEETEEGENAFASLIAENESLYIDDPKKALKGFYEREGCDLPDYQFTEIAMGKHKCRLELPVDGPNGEELVAEAIVSGKRKDAVVACALEACRILDRLGLLRSSTHESRKRKQKKWEDDDFYDSDEDTFLDRTGTIEKKRVMRMKKAGKDEPETYDSLLEKYNKVSTQIQDIENKLQKAKADAEALASEEMDELDAYMVSIKSGAMDTKTRMKLKGDLLKLKVEEQKLRKLVNIAKPALLPPLQPFKPSVTATTPVADVLSRKLHSQQKQNKKVTPVRKQAQVDLKPDDFQEEDDDDEEDLSKESSSIPKDISSESPNKASDNEVPSSPNNTGLTAIKDKSSKSEKTTKNIVKGPSLPPPKTEEKPVKKSDSVHQTSTRSFLKSLDKSQAASKPKPNPNFDSADPDYAMWLPPSEQSGDGRTSLNDKLGY